MSYLNQSQKDVAGLLTLGIHVSKAAATLPASTAQDLFVVAGGHVRVTLMYGIVTTVIEGTNPVPKITSTPTVGTAVDVASTVDISSLEVGGILTVEGDGTALIKGNAGAGMPGTGVGWWVCATGKIQLITGATKTGATRWELFYFPLDDGASVVSA